MNVEHPQPSSNDAVLQLYSTVTDGDEILQLCLGRLEEEESETLGASTTSEGRNEFPLPLEEVSISELFAPRFLPCPRKKDANCQAVSSMQFQDVIRIGGRRIDGCDEKQGSVSEVLSTWMASRGACALEPLTVSHCLSSLQSYSERELLSFFSDSNVLGACIDRSTDPHSLRPLEELLFHSHSPTMSSLVLKKVLGSILGSTSEIVDPSPLLVLCISHGALDDNKISDEAKLGLVSTIVDEVVPLRILTLLKRTELDGQLLLAIRSRRTKLESASNTMQHMMMQSPKEGGHISGSDASSEGCSSKPPFSVDARVVSQMLSRMDN